MSVLRVRPACFLQGLLSPSVTSRHNVLWSLQDAVQRLEEETRRLEDWRRQHSIPAEKALYKAVHKAHPSKLPALKVAALSLPVSAMA